MENKVVIITGGNRGIGYGITQAFLKEGYNVVMNYRSNVDATSEALAELDSQNVFAIQADVSIKEERILLLEQTLSKFGRIDVLVNNAAVTSRNGFFKTS